MSDENKQYIIGFDTISTNAGKNVVHDVTKDDLADILENMLKVSKAEKLTTILETIANHMKATPDPHEVSIDQLAESAVDRMYNYWLNQGFRGTLEQFQACIYKYNVICDFFTLFVGKDETQITSVKNVAERIRVHDTYINDYENVNVFVISEKESKWHGYISGMRLQTDESLEYADPSIETVSHNANGDPWYEWFIVVPKHMFNSKVSINVDTNNTNYTIKYRILETDNTLTYMPNVLTIEPVNNKEYLTYVFKLEYTTTPFKLNDIITTVDTSLVLTDDENRLALFRDVAHDCIWQDFFMIGKIPHENFAWFANINLTELENTDVSDWFVPKCTFNVAMQAHQNLLVDHKGYPGLIDVPVFTLTDGNNIFEIYSRVIGEFTSYIPTIENMTTLGSVYLGINLTWGTDNIKKIITNDIVASNKALYRFICTCDFTTNTYKIMFNNGNTVDSVTKTYSGLAFSLLHPTKWKIKYPANFTTNTFIGLHELVHYPTIVTDMDFISKIIFMDMSDIPYVPYRHIDLIDTNFGFAEANYEPFDTYPFAK